MPFSHYQSLLLFRDFAGIDISVQDMYPESCVACVVLCAQKLACEFFINGESLISKISMIC